MTYEEAVQLRLEAETGADPFAYLRAAVAFEILGMTAARQRMLDRAAHYQQQPEYQEQLV